MGYLFNIYGMYKFNEFNKINEKVVEGIDKDVDYIYEFYEKDINEIKKTGILKEDMFNYFQIKTSDLKSKISKECHSKNPCEIHINHNLKLDGKDLGNFYTPKETNIFPNKDIGIIGITIHKYAKHLVLAEGDGDIKVSEFMFKGISREFEEYKIKGTIRHELSHWIDDTLNNRYLTKILKGKYLNNIAKKKKVDNVNALFFEIQAIVQNIYQLKKEFNDVWDDLTFDEMVDKLPPLSNIKSNMTPTTYKKWKRKLKEKMWKSNLLGKKMV